MSEKVSIIMPAYNAENSIRESIESVINQSFSNWKLLVIDDGSTDKTISIVKEYSKRNNKISLLENPRNIGVSATRNRGINLATGEWLAFLDSDDIWDVFKLEKQIEIAEKRSKNFVFSGVKYINENGKGYPGIFEVPDKVDFDDLKKHNVISCSSVIVKKDVVGSIRMERDDMHEDFAFWLRILKKGEIAIGLNEPLLIYRLSPKSKSGNKFKTLRMTYKVYRFIDISVIKSCYYTICHISSSFKKYKGIFQTK